jgi:hypothetical protein
VLGLPTPTAIHCTYVPVVFDRNTFTAELVVLGPVYAPHDVTVPGTVVRAHANTVGFWVNPE